MFFYCVFLQLNILRKRGLAVLAGRLLAGTLTHIAIWLLNLANVATETSPAMLEEASQLPAIPQFLPPFSRGDRTVPPDCDILLLTAILNCVYCTPYFF